MAHILQAAQWLAEGKTVTREGGTPIPGYHHAKVKIGEHGLLTCVDHKQPVHISLEALQADDWKVVDVKDPA